MVDKFFEKNGDYFYFVFRVLVGLLFIQHGMQKLFGSFGGVGPDGGSVPLIGLFGLAGIIEFFGGLFLILGLFTRLAALFGIFDMIGAYYKAHWPQGYIPLLNQGELAALYFACFLVILALGARKWGIDNSLSKKKK